jgi:hypothetical protein
MKKLILIFIIFSISSKLFPVKFISEKGNREKVVFQTIFELGFSMAGVVDLYGLTEYQSVFFKTAFHVNDFGIGLDH